MSGWVLVQPKSRDRSGIPASVEPRPTSERPRPTSEALVPMSKKGHISEEVQNELLEDIEDMEELVPARPRGRGRSGLEAIEEPRPTSEMLIPSPKKNCQTGKSPRKEQGAKCPQKSTLSPSSLGPAKTWRADPTGKSA